MFSPSVTDVRKKKFEKNYENKSIGIVIVDIFLSSKLTLSK